jgi:hypothetical protein
VALSSCFRQAEGRPSAALPESASWQEPAAAWCQTAGAAAAQVTASPSEMKAVAVAESVRQAASALQVLLPAEGVAAASGAKVQPPGAAEAESALLVRQLAAAEVPSGAGVVPQPAAAAVALDAVAEPRRAVAAAAAARLDAEVQRPGVGVAAEPAPSVRRPAAGHPSAPPSWRLEGQHLRPWLAPRPAVRSAHGMRRSRTASPSRQSWRAAGCEGLSWCPWSPEIGLTATERPALTRQLVD